MFLSGKPRLPVYCDGCEGEGGHVDRHVDTWSHNSAQNFTKNPSITHKCLNRRKGRAKTHDDIGGGEVDEVDIYGGPHVLVAQDHVKHHQVPADPEYEDDHIQTDEDCLHPGLKNVVLHITNPFKFTAV